MPVSAGVGVVVVGTVTITSFEGALTVLPLPARTRTKYVPALTPLAENKRKALPVEKLARLLAPGDEPASMIYVVGAHPPTGAAHVKVTENPLTIAVKLSGAPGLPLQGPTETLTTISPDEAPTPELFLARTRTK
jgi:hypothetical protein